MSIWDLDETPSRKTGEPDVASDSGQVAPGSGTQQAASVTSETGTKKPKRSSPAPRVPASTVQALSQARLLLQSIAMMSRHGDWNGDVETPRFGNSRRVKEGKRFVQVIRLLDEEIKKAG